MSNPATSSGSLWTPDRLALAKRLYLEQGLTASQVVDRLGCGLTRSALLGKFHRLGLFKPGRRNADPEGVGAPSQPRLLPRAAAPPRRKIAITGRLPPPLPARPLPPLREVPLQGRPSSLAQLPPGGCHWPLDDPGFGRMDRTLFCAAPAGDHRYCSAHRALAFVPPKASVGQLWSSLRRYA